MKMKVVFCYLMERIVMKDAGDDQKKVISSISFSKLPFLYDHEKSKQNDQCAPLVWIGSHTLLFFPFWNKKRFKNGWIVSVMYITETFAFCLESQERERYVVSLHWGV